MSTPLTNRRPPTRNRATDWTARASVVIEQRLRHLRRDDRGDVPGWVLVTLMTAGLVTALWIVAGKQLGDVFESAIANVKP